MNIKEPTTTTNAVARALVCSFRSFVRLAQSLTYTPQHCGNQSNNRAKAVSRSSQMKWENDWEWASIERIMANLWLFLSSFAVVPFAIQSPPHYPILAFIFIPIHHHSPGIPYNIQCVDTKNNNFTKTKHISRRNGRNRITMSSDCVFRCIFQRNGTEKPIMTG